MSEIAVSNRQIVGSERVKERDALAETFIEPTGSYFDLKPNLNLNGAADGYHVGVSLFQDISHEGGVNSKLDELSKAAECLFKFRPGLFRFSVGRPQKVAALLRQPFSHADLEEEEIEEKFPHDIRRRALLKALNHVLVRNQIRHIVRKRTYQSFYSIAAVVILTLWMFFGPSVSSEALARVGISLSPYFLLGAWAVAFALIFSATYFFLKFLYERDLRNTTDRFKASNRTACATASESMTNFSTEVGERFSLLLNAIKSSEDHLELVRKPHWPAHGREIFRVALWDAKRVESIEKFWQLQFERLRIYELILDRVGNISSLTLAWAIVVVTGLGLTLTAYFEQNLIAGIQALAVFVGVFWISQRFGAASRREELSFDMDDIIRQGIETSWSPFAHLDYYNRIAQEIENGLGAKRINKIEGIFQGSGRS